MTTSSTDQHYRPDEKKTEEKVLAGIERFITRLVDKWDAMPEEKQEEVIEKIHAELTKGRDRDAGITRPSREEEAREKSIGKLRRALGFSAVAGLILTFTGSWFWLVVLVLFGVLPAAKASLRLAGEWLARRRASRDRPKTLESKVLRVAAAAEGVVSVVMVAASGAMSLDEAQQTLDSMAAHGYANLLIRDDGTVAYEFPGLNLSREALPVV